MEVGNKAEVNLILRQFKHDNGSVNFPSVLTIPRTERIPTLAKQDFTRINLLIIGALTVCIEGLGLKRSLNEIEILDLSETIIDSANEDNLSFEDLMLFLQGLSRGRYKITNESLTVPKFMDLFEIYRQERWEGLLNHRDELEAQYKCFGDTGKSTQRDVLSEHFANMGERMSQMKERISDLKQENTSLKMDKE